MATIALRRFQSVTGPAIGALALVASAWFITRIVHTLDAGRAEAAPAAIAHAPAPPPPPPPPRRDDDALVARNMFCASCTGRAPPDPGAPRGAPRFTARLIATTIESDDRGAATLFDPESGAGGWFPTGAIAPGGAVIVAVRRGAIDVRFPDDTLETVTLGGSAPPATATAAAPSASASAWGDRVRGLGDDRWEVDRGLIGELVGGGATAAVPGVRLMPVTKDGKLAGIKVAAARTGSLARALGLELGDVIEAVDGAPIESAATLMTLYGELDQRTRVALTVRRGGATRALTYDLR